MTVTSISEENVRQGSSSINGNRIVRNSRREWLVKTDSPNHYAEDILVTTGVPQVGDEHPDDPFLICKTVNAMTPKEWKTDWKVTAEYSNEVPEFNGPEPKVSRPPEVSFSTEYEELPIFRDKNGNAIVNTAKQPYEDTLTERIPVRVVNVKRWEPTFTSDFHETYAGKVNSTTFDGRDAGLVLLDDLSANILYEDGEIIYEVTYVFKMKRTTWQPIVPSMGYMRIPDGLPNEIRRIKDDNGEDITSPAFLDAAGEKIDQEDLPGAIVLTQHDTIDAVDFNKLGLPL